MIHCFFIFSFFLLSLMMDAKGKGQIWETEWLMQLLHAVSTFQQRGCFASLGFTKNFVYWRKASLTPLLPAHICRDMTCSSFLCFWKPTSICFKLWKLGKELELLCFGCPGIVIYWKSFLWNHEKCSEIHISSIILE